eukprot:1295510-Rhodomonas_salina.1
MKVIVIGTGLMVLSAACASTHVGATEADATDHYPEESMDDEHGTRPPMALRFQYAWPYDFSTYVPTMCLVLAEGVVLLIYLLAMGCPVLR